MAKKMGRKAPFLFINNTMLYNLKSLQDIIFKGLNTYAGMSSTMLELLPHNSPQYAYFKLLERFTRDYPRPEFELGVKEAVVLEKPFCNLLKFETDSDKPPVMIVAPLSGHYSTLLRGTVNEFLDHPVYITDWKDASSVSLDEGIFSFEDYVEYIREFIEYFDGDIHIIAVCQPGVPTLAAISLQAQNNKVEPKSLTLMGSPIDVRVSPTEVNKFADKHDMEWFKSHVIHTVPIVKDGAGRKVYPGFLQLSGFMSMNMDKHLQAFHGYFDDLCKGDDDSVESHEKFYDEYLSVMDLDAQFYLETIQWVFKEYRLPKGELVVGGVKVDPAAITKTSLLTIEGENDDITGLGQTEATHKLCSNIPNGKHHIEKGVGHYGVFNGSKFRNNIAPMIKEFISNT